MSNEITVADLFSHHKGLTEGIKREIETYSTCLIGIRNRNTDFDAELVGSGTFAHFEDKYVVLTASHVIEKKLKKFDALGLSLSNSEHRWYEILERLNIIHMGIPKNYDDCEGPDLSIIQLPQNRIGDIKARRAFHNLNRPKDKFLNKTKSRALKELWCLSGFIGDWTVDGTSTHNFQQTINYGGIVGFGGAEPLNCRGDFDYLQAKVIYEPNTYLPKGFGGLSGGGLWRVELHRLENGELSNGFPILAGMAFCQSKVQDNTRHIKCHGSRSIYEMVVKKLNN